MKSINEPLEIKPFAVYTASEAANFLRVDKRKVYELIENKIIVGMDFGRGYKVLGENLLRFMGSPSIAQMKPEGKSLEELAKISK